MKKYLIYMFIIGIFLPACNEDNQIFEETSDIRVAKQIAECDRTLKSATAGWKMSYYPNEEKFGSFNLFFRFQENNRVTIGTDYNINWEKSTYRLNADEGVVLDFDTYSSLHELADPKFGNVGKGYEGDFELLVQKITPDTIYCKGRKHGKAMNLIRAEQQDWEDLKSYARNTMLLMPGKDDPFFRNLYVGKKGIATLIYNNQTRFMNVNYYNNGIYVNQELPVIVTADGFRLSEPMEIDGRNIQDFIYDKMAQRFVTAGSDVMGEIRLSDTSTVVFSQAWEKFRSKEIGHTLKEMSGSIIPMWIACRQSFPQLAGVQLYWNLLNLGDFFVFRSLSPDRSLLIMMREKIIREDAVVFTLDGRILQAGEIIAGEAEAMTRNNNILSFINIWFNAKGFTVVPTGKNSFSLVSREDSRCWLRF